MPKSGPIIIVEDDLDDHESLTEVICELKIRNELKFFTRCADAFHYLKSMQDSPFIIICDINMPGLNGLEFKRKIDQDPVLRIKSIPFVFLSTAVPINVLTEAYTKMNVQGFFQKPNTIAGLKSTIGLILEYWHLSKHPNSFI